MNAEYENELEDSKYWFLSSRERMISRSKCRCWHECWKSSAILNWLIFGRKMAFAWAPKILFLVDLCFGNKIWLKQFEVERRCRSLCYVPHTGEPESITRTAVLYVISHASEAVGSHWEWATVHSASHISSILRIIGWALTERCSSELNAECRFSNPKSNVCAFVCSQNIALRQKWKKVDPDNE